MSSKKLMTGLTILMVVALATIGVAYGAWTDQLNINGNVTTGTFDVRMDYLYVDAAVAGCNAAISADGKTLTVTIANAYPGYACGGGVSIRNLGTVAAKINGLVQVANTVPAAFTVTPPGLVYMTDAVGNVVPSGGSFGLAAGATGGGVMWNFAIPASETGHEGETYTFSYTFLAEQ
jgi:predicted ribosomally synthesized peptide with SipW-like signal peptide